MTRPLQRAFEASGHDVVTTKLDGTEAAARLAPHLRRVLEREMDQ